MTCVLTKLSRKKNTHYVFDKVQQVTAVEYHSHNFDISVTFLFKVFLIVAPLSVLYNWKDELDTWGHFQCVVVHGLRKEEELARIKKGRVEIALTTYETLRLCLDQFNK